MCQLFPAGTLTDIVTLEKLKNAFKLVFTQEFVQFSRWHGLEGFICGSKDRVDPFPVEHLRQPCRLDGGYQHAVDTAQNVSPALRGLSLSHVYLSTAGRWSPEHPSTPCKNGMIPVCLFSP